MSANNQIIVAPFPSDLEKYAVWHDGCVDNPFNFSAEPLATFDTLEEAVVYASDYVSNAPYPIEYGLHVIPKSKVSGYEQQVWDEFPDYEYLGILGYSGIRG